MNRWAKAALLVVAIAAGIVLLFTVVFPWVDTLIQDPVLGAPPPR